jgi:hypothetical protein
MNLLNAFRADRRQARRSDRKSRLQVEQLEDRMVPTILFSPTGYGAEQLTSNSQRHAMQSPNVNLLFWGSYWGTQQGLTDQMKIGLNTLVLLNSPYLTGLIEYGSDGKANPGKVRYDYSDPQYNGQPGFTVGQLNAEVDSKIYNPNDQNPIYVVITAPGVTGADQPSGTGGYNKLDLNKYHFAWVGTGSDSPGGPVNIDGFTRTLSHELVEGMSYATDGTGIGVIPPSGVPNPQNQIADNEGEFYGYRLAGMLVATYWSYNNQAFIVPDGNQQNFTLYPKWDSNHNFQGNYNLYIQGGQLGPGNPDTAVFTQPGPGLMQVSLNNEVVRFDPNTIKVASFAGDQTNMWVNGLPGGVTLNIRSLYSSSNTHVTVGAGGSLANVAGTVNVGSNVSDPGKEALTVDDAGDNTNYRNLTITSSQVKVSGDNNGAEVINYYGATANRDGTLHGVTALQVNGPGGDLNYFFVESTARNTPVTVVTGSRHNEVDILGTSSAVTVQDWGTDNITVGGGSLTAIAGPVNISQASGTTSLSINDAGDNSARTIIVTDHSVFFEGLTTIWYQPATKYGNGLLGVTELQVKAPRVGNNFFDIDSVGQYVNVDIYLQASDDAEGSASRNPNVHYHVGGY